MQYVSVSVQMCIFSVLSSVCVYLNFLLIPLGLIKYQSIWTEKNTKEYLFEISCMGFIRHIVLKLQETFTVLL